MPFLPVGGEDDGGNAGRDETVSSVDYEDDDQLITGFIASAEQLCRDVLRADETADLEKDETVKIAVMYATAYFYEHREEADHHDLALTIRSLLFGSRKEAF